MKSLLRNTLLTSAVALGVVLALAGTASAAPSQPPATPTNAPAAAAAATGSIVGTLTSATGAPLAGARVTTLAVFGSTDIGYHTATADANGHYLIDGVLPGRYTVSFTPQSLYFELYVPGTTDYAAASVITVVADLQSTADGTALPTGTIAGHYATAAGAAPWTSVTIEAPNRGMVASTSTNNEGGYALEVYAGTYTVGFSASDGSRQYAHQRATRAEADTFQVVAGQTITVDDTQIPGGDIAGRLLDTDGTPVAGAQVTASAPEQWRSTTTAADGTYRISGLIPGDYTVEFSSADRQRRQRAYGATDPADAAVIAVRAGETTTVNDTLVPTGSLTVTVTDADTGAPVAGACVGLSNSINSRYVCGNATGVVTITGIPATNYSLNVNDSESRYLGEDRSGITITAGRTTTLAVALNRAAFIRAAVVDAATGLPVDQVCVYALTLTDAAVGEGSGGNCTDETGKVEIGYLTAGTYTLLARPRDSAYGIQWVGADGGTGDQYQAKKITIAGGQTVTVPVIELDPAGSITGTVTDAAGAPVAGVCVATTPISSGWHRTGNCLGAITTTSGGYTVSGLGPYDWPVEFASGDRQSDTHEFSYAWQWSGRTANRRQAAKIAVATGQTATLDTTLSRGTAVRATVVDAAGNPVSGSSITVVNAVTGDPAGESDYLDGIPGVLTVRILPQDVKVEFVEVAPDGTWRRGWYDRATSFATATTVKVRPIDVTLTMSLPAV